MGEERAGWQGIPAVQSSDNANYSMLTAVKYNLERIIAVLDAAGFSGSGTNNMLLQSLSEVNSEMDGMEASIRVEQQARIDGDAALALQIQTIIATGDGSNSTYLQTEPPGPPTYTLNIGDLWFDSDDNFKMYRWSGTAWAAVDDQRIAANVAAITHEQQVRIEGDEALALDIEALAVVVSDGDETLTGSIYDEQQARIEADGVIVGTVTELTGTVSNNYTTVTGLISDEAEVRADADGAATLRMNSMQSSIDTNKDGVAENLALIKTEETTRANADGAQALRIDKLETTTINQGTDIANTNVRITNETTARTNADSALGLRIDSLTATVDGIDGDVGDAEALIAEEARVRAEYDSAQSIINTTVSTTLGTLDGKIGTVDARVTTEQEARAQGDQALATSIQTVSTTVDGHTSSITQITSSINGIYGEYTLTVDAGGAITGFELISGAGKSEFIVRAEHFRIENSTGIPFEVIGGTTYLRNVVIQTGGIDTSKLQENATFDFDYVYVDFGGWAPSPPLSTWYPVNFPGVGALRVTVTAADKASQVVNITAAVILRGFGSSPDRANFQVVRTNDNKVLQLFGPIWVKNDQTLPFVFEFYDSAPLVNTPATYELQFMRAVGGPSSWFQSSMKGIVYKR